MKLLITGLLGTSLLVSAPMAQAALLPRASAPVEDANAMAGGGIAVWVALAALAVAIYLAADSGSSPDSP